MKVKISGQTLAGKQDAGIGLKYLSKNTYA